METITQQLNNRLKLKAEICYSWEPRKYYRAFLALVDMLQDEGYYVTYELTRIIGGNGELEVFLQTNGEALNVFSKLKTGEWLDDHNIKLVISKIKEVVQQ